ncbi:N-formylglutamate amidohydrolase [Minwuia thermotolerans]|uniref:N-formylglutamate amidohydrolase n=1 Tax=Minwuia thermotolerans TaxID=2056226 RepID=A0A2M9G2P0_9PROT|nr:N-formylglutamate amidohydrolase [Minwuia thermotolerans]PJK29981.1 N-formylglutamate amidohydrolase [Minwuia thermotolerans]
MQIDPSHSLIDPPVDARLPDVQTMPVVLASPHSGSTYPPEFLAASRLDRHAIRKSEDSFVDEIFMPASDRGAPLLRALFPRAYCDVNREPYELDPKMFSDALPAHANTSSLRVAGGLGTIARVVSSGEDIYHSKLSYAEAERRIRRYYRPYHDALSTMVQDTFASFGVCIIIDCHSMPSQALPTERRRAGERPDIVLGDRFGTSCARGLSDLAHEFLSARGYAVSRNAPYAGGFCTTHYGRPAAGLHALQIEINRAIYMDEARYRRLPRMTRLAGDLADMVEALSRIEGWSMRSAAE